MAIIFPSAKQFGSKTNSCAQLAQEARVWPTDLTALIMENIKFSNFVQTKATYYLTDFLFYRIAKVSGRLGVFQHFMQILFLTFIAMSITYVPLTDFDMINKTPRNHLQSTRNLPHPLFSA